MKTIEGIKARIYPSWRQQIWLTKEFGDARFVWNHMIDYAKPQINHYIKAVKNYGKKYARKQHIYPTESKLDNYLSNMFKALCDWLSIADSRSLEIEIKNLLTAYNRYFSQGAGWPKFKSRKNYVQSYTTSYIPKQPDGCRRYLKLSKLGKVQAHFNMPVIGKVKRVTITKDNLDHYYASLIVECEKQALPKTGKMVGIDVGLNHLLTLSNGIKYDFKHFDKFVSHKKHVWERKRARRLVRAKKIIRYCNKKHRRNSMYYVPELRDFKNYQKARIMVAKYSRHVKDQRKNYIQWLTTRLVQHYDLIAIEDLKVSKMVRNHNLAHSVEGGAWRMFRTDLEYKCKWYGKKLVTVNKNYTTQKCFNCGYNMSKHHDKIQLGVESWTCPNCHTKHGRDINAALNILRKGLE